MKNETVLALIKILHTAVWVVMASATIYIFYAGVIGIFSIWLWISIGLLVLESLVLFVNKWFCPLTPMAMKYTENREANFDIYLPEKLAKYNKQIFGTIFITGLLIVILRIILSFY